MPFLFTSHFFATYTDRSHIAFILVLTGEKQMNVRLTDPTLFPFLNRPGISRDNTIRLGMYLWWLVVFGGCASHPFADLEEWKEIRTTNFMFYTNAEEDVAFDFAK